jgi:hypothetical protein
MVASCRTVVLSLGLLLGLANSAVAQIVLPAEVPAAAPAASKRAAATQSSSSGDWKVAVYPVLAWLPLDIGLDVQLPFDVDGGGGGNGGGGGGDNRPGGSIVDGRFDGAYLAGVAATNGVWRIEADGVFAAIGGDRAAPNLTVDVDLIYGYVSGGRRIAKNLFVTAGLRRLALDYDITLAGFETFSNKPGLWDPLVGIGYHHVGDSFEFHASFEGGGFGVGADSDIGGTARVDWKPFRHFGFTAGYNFYRLKFNRDVGPLEFSVTQRTAGPVAGIGLYF